MVLNAAIAITAFIIAFLILPVIIKYSFQKNLVDTPGRRKIHAKETPRLGGIAVFMGFLVGLLVWMEYNEIPNVKYRLASLGAMFFLGVRDDLVPLKATHKLLGQIIAAFILVHLADIRLTSLYGIFGYTDYLPMWVSYILSIFTLIIIINSFNLIDGLDGLAGTLACVSLLFFGIWFYLTGDIYFSILSFAMFGSLLAFMIFNWEPADIFMGDAGALLLGLLLGMMAIKFIDTNYYLPADDPYRFNASVSAGVCAIVIPLIDTARIIILRLLKKQSPFSPDKSHIHHGLMRMGMGHAQVAITLGLVHLGFLAVLFILKPLPDKFMLPIIIIIAISLSASLDRLIIKRLSKRPNNL